MKQAWLFHAVVLAVVAVGCGAKVTVDTPGGAGGSSGTAGTGGAAAGSVSCDLRVAGSHVCVTYEFGTASTGSGSLLSAEESACMSSGGTTGPCPTASALGTCTVSQSGVSEVETFYSDGSPPLTVADAQIACTSAGGTFN